MEIDPSEHQQNWSIFSKFVQDWLAGNPHKLIKLGWKRDRREGNDMFVTLTEIFKICERGKRERGDIVQAVKESRLFRYSKTVVAGPLGLPF